MDVPLRRASRGGPRRSWRDARHLYRPTIDGLPGNDDLGGLSSWHALDMLGLGALVPGAPYFALGSPAFERAEIDTGRRHVHDRVARARGPYVADASLNGAPLDRAWIRDSEMTGTLRLERSTDGERGVGRRRTGRPSGTDLSAFGCG